MVKVSAKILVVEDEADLAESTTQSLNEEGFAATSAPTGRIACRLLDDHWDLVILDLGLPDMPGELVLSYLKQQAAPPPVLVLTARALINDKLQLFKRGCDDYLTKPFVFEELLVRIQALLRRHGRGISERRNYEDLTLDPVSHTLSTGAKQVGLTPKEVAICEILMREPGRVITRKEILQGVWGLNEEPQTNFIGVHIFNLRKKFGQVGKDSWFQTIRMSGFVLRNPS